MRPIENATVRISYTGDPTNVLEELKTNSNGQTEIIKLNAPPVEYSLEPSAEQPYSEYNVEIIAPDYEPIVINGIEILAEQNALQNANLTPIPEAKTPEGASYVIGPHTLFGDYPPKIAEAEIKAPQETGEIVLDKVVIPEYVIVHDGPPSDPSAADYYVKYKDYIKNVASSEIYATWPQSTIEANIYAIMSFTLNRVFTEWYRNKGLTFTITSSTAYDHKWIPNRNIYENISRTVDTLFASYLSRPNVKQPILTQYCDGNRVQCPNWMTQWGSKDLGTQGYSAIEILRHFYGSNMYINTANEVSGVPSSWPGFNLTIGASGDKVRQMQSQLNTISDAYTLIPKVAVDGQFGANTAEAVKVFQTVFKLPSTGIVDYPTWYKISEIYVGVSRIGELV
jgi:peptidoglycan hydrolase-like protein with peptidoglycan-binding domain